MVTSMWASASSWFSPTVLFCVLNLMIGTIFIISSLKPQKLQNELGTEGSNPPHQLVRTPSLLERVKSFNFSMYRSEQPNPFPFEAQHVVPDEDREQKVDEAEVLTEDLASNHMTGSKSESSTETLAKRRSRKIKKSLSEKAVAFEREEGEDTPKVGDVDRQRPATVRERKGRWSDSLQAGDEAVDKKADDFINRFRQQLKLQRLDSILRYKEMLNRGAGK